jgi:hypothetical protein
MHSLSKVFSISLISKNLNITESLIEEAIEQLPPKNLINYQFDK